MGHYRKYFSAAIALSYPDSFPSIISTTDQYYLLISADTAFAKKSKNPIDRRLDFCAYFLSLIKTLDEKGESFENIRKICLDINIGMVRPKNRFSRFSKKIFPQLTLTWLGKVLIKMLQKKVRVNENPDGFVAEIITDKEQTFGLGYGVDILECGICKLFNKHNSSRFASILCEVDEITTAQAGLKLIRSGTIANGAKKCDFRYQKINNKQ